MCEYDKQETQPTSNRCGSSTLKGNQMNVRILVADDEKYILDLIEKFMKKYGYQADLADNVADALALLKEHEYDVIITDKNMPDEKGNIEGGMTLLRYTMKHMPSAEVIMITGYATIETAVEAMKLGAFDYIMKPIPLDDLKEKIDRVLEYKRFISSGDSLQTYRALHNEVLNLLENRDDLPQDKLREMLRTLGSNIDQVFGMQKEYETIIQVQADALKKIEGYVEILKDAVPKDSPYYELVKKIREESEKKI